MNYNFDIKANPNLVISLGIYIRNKRISQNIGLREMAEKLNISPAYLSNLEAGKHNMTNPLLLKKIARILKIDHLKLFKIIGYTDKDTEEIKSEIWTEIIEEISNKDIADILEMIITIDKEKIEDIKNILKE